MPAIVRWPGKVKPGSITGELAATYDIFTTVRQYTSLDSNLCFRDLLSKLHFANSNAQLVLNIAPFHGFKVEPICVPEGST